MGALHGEWTKIRTVRSTGWLAAAAALGTVAAGAAISAAQNPRDCAAPCAPDVVKLSLSGSYAAREYCVQWEAGASGAIVSYRLLLRAAPRQAAE